MKISKIENILINLLTPIDSFLNWDNFWEVADKKKEDYFRLIKYNSGVGKIPDDVEWAYNIPLCGRLQLFSARLRKYVL